METINKINVYKCPNGHETVTINRADGVTPMFMTCRNRDCEENATSQMYMCSQDLTPEFEWYRSVNKNVLPPEARKHHDNGGLFFREIPTPLQP